MMMIDATAAYTQVIQIAPEWTVTLALDASGRKLCVAVTSPHDSTPEDCQFICTTAPSGNTSTVPYGWVGERMHAREMIHVEQGSVVDSPPQSRKRKFSLVDTPTQSKAIVPLSTNNSKKVKRDPSIESSPLLMNLPLELQLHIFSFIPPLNLAQEVQLVCSDWRRLAQDESLWRVVHQKLWEGPKSKDCSWKKDCLQVKREVQYRNDLHATKMLLWAAQRGYLGLIKHILQNSNITVNASNKKKVTALLVASEVGHTKVVEHLLSRHAEVEAAASKSATSLYMAAQHGHEEVVRMLLKAGANVDAKTDYGTTALFVAAQMGNASLVKLLLAHGANVNIPMNNAQTPLFVAVREGNIEIVRMLLNASADVNAERSDGTTPLVMAAYKGFLDIVKLLVQSGARVDAAPQGGMNALFVASQQGATEIVTFLLENTSSNLHAATAGGTTPLLIATQKGHLGVVEVLLRHGANIKGTLKDGTTPLMIAEVSGFSEIASILRREEQRIKGFGDGKPGVSKGRSTSLQLF